MTADQLRNVVLEALTRITPEVEASAIRLDAALRDQLDIDSMDFLNFVIALHEKLGVNIPETDYSKLSTVDAIVGYLGSKLDAGKRPAS
jgi:acyl carrier protein